MGRDLEPSIISLLAHRRSMTAEEVAGTLDSDEESVTAALQQMKHSNWVIDMGDGHWRAAKPGLGN